MACGSRRKLTTADFTVRAGDDGRGGFVWKPSAVLENDFPNEISPDVSMEEAQRFASRGSNKLIVSQPGKPEEGQDTSDWFVMSIGEAKQFYRRQYQAGLEAGMEQGRQGWNNEKRKWILGVAIGVPVGTLLLTALAWFIGYRVGKGRATKRVGKGI